MRGVNAEGDGAWATGSAITDANAVSRSVDENSAAGDNVGAAVTATSNPNNYTFSHSLSGTDASKFSIDSSSGQITVGTGTALNYESGTTSYSVVVTVKAAQAGPGAEPEPDPQRSGELRHTGHHQRDGRERAAGQAGRAHGNFHGQLGQQDAEGDLDGPGHDGQAAHHRLRRAIPEARGRVLAVPHLHRNGNQLEHSATWWEEPTTTCRCGPPTTKAPAPGRTAAS